MSTWQLLRACPALTASSRKVSWTLLLLAPIWDTQRSVPNWRRKVSSQSECAYMTSQASWCLGPKRNITYIIRFSIIDINVLIIINEHIYRISITPGTLISIQIWNNNCVGLVTINTLDNWLDQTKPNLRL